MPTDTLDLRSSVQFLKGVGTQRAEILERIGLRKASDLLFYFPRDYQDMTERRDFSQLEETKITQTIVGTIEEWNRKSTRRGEMLTRIVDCGSASPLKFTYYSFFPSFL